MQLFSYNFTDLASFDSPSREIWIDEDDLSDFAKRAAREMLNAVPDLTNKGVCVAIYDQQANQFRTYRSTLFNSLPNPLVQRADS